VRREGVFQERRGLFGSNLPATGMAKKSLPHLEKSATTHTQMYKSESTCREDLVEVEDRVYRGQSLHVGKIRWR